MRGREGRARGGLSDEVQGSGEEAGGRERGAALSSVRLRRREACTRGVSVVMREVEEGGEAGFQAHIRDNFMLALPPFPQSTRPLSHVDQTTLDSHEHRLP